MRERLTVDETIEILCSIDGNYNFDESEEPRGNIGLYEAVKFLEELKKYKEKENVTNGN